jgi:divalent metal cation (Fe/Co/Zn/Cd) transporter
LVSADGIHSLSDVFSSFLILVALCIASRSFSLFPIGLNKLENLASLIGSIAIFVAGYEIIHSIFVEGSIAISDSMEIIILFVTLIVIIEIIFYYYEKKAAKRLNSPGVETETVNWLGDMKF